MRKKKLTPKQERFVEEYLIDLNATQAAIRAGYSARRAKEIGYQLLHKTTLQETIQKARQKLSERVRITQEKVLKDLETARQLAMETKKLSAAIRASELQGRHIGMFEQKIKLAGDEKEPLIVKIIHYSELKKARQADD